MQAPRWRCKIPTLCIGKVQAIKVLSLNQWPNICLIFNLLTCCTNVPLFSTAKLQIFFHFRKFFLKEELRAVR